MDKLYSLANPYNEFLETPAEIVFRHDHAALLFERVLRVSGFYRYHKALLCLHGNCGVRVLPERRLALVQEWDSHKTHSFRYLTAYAFMLDLLLDVLDKLA